MQKNLTAILSADSVQNELDGPGSFLGGKEITWTSGRSFGVNHSFHLNDMARIARKFALHATPAVIGNSVMAIGRDLSSHGITFEGRLLPVSLMPTVVSYTELQLLEKSGNLVRQVLNRVLAMFVAEHRRKIFDGPMHRFFIPYYRWWDCIAAENRHNDPIMLMRYDAVRDSHGRWSFMETNTCCPGGTIHCARIRDAWLAAPLGRALSQGETISEFSVDSPAGFVRFLVQKAAEIDPENPNIAILNYRGTYTNELESLRRCHESMYNEKTIGSGTLLLGDLRDITYVDGQAWLNGKPLALIYNKIDQLAIDPHAAEVQSWLAASVGTRTEFLNSLGSMYLTETKRTLALLSDPCWNVHLNLTPEEEQAIREVVPFTRLIEDFVENDDLSMSLPARHQLSFVVKADALTRGSGVTIGDQATASEWKEALSHTRLNNGVAQLKCHLPTRPASQVDLAGNLVSITEYYGVDVFFFGNEFSGLVSRSHTSQIFNVGNGGRESPVLIIGDVNG